MTGHTISHYRVLEKLGEGGMGLVYKAEDTKLGRTVALKFLPSPALEHRERFLREAQTAAVLNHPNICIIYEVDDEHGFIAMEYVEGCSLKEKIEARPLPLDEAIDIAIQACAGVRAAHEKGVVHRDIKPANLMFTTQGQVKIMDFGLALVGDRTRITKAGASVGTPAYMSPEQVRGGTIDRRTDLWSLGVTLYEGVSGRTPFRGATGEAVSYNILHSEPEPLTALRSGVPMELDRIVAKALRKDSVDRYQNAEDLMVDLRQLKSRQPVAKGKHRVWIAIATAGALLAAAAILLLQSTKQFVPPSPAKFVQLTSFTDSAVQPSLSADGRMLAFIRGSETFIGAGEIYVKLLPDGDPTALTDDGLQKMSPAFVPGGTRIVYTARTGIGPGDTWSVPVLGGEPARMLSNAEALSFIESASGPPRVLFSEWGVGFHLSVISSSPNRSDARTVYSPPAIDGMAHRSYLSPDRKQVLIVEMEGGWRPCRLVPFDGGTPAKLVGPSPSQCTTAAWSPDGGWMYFSANTGNGYHIWRQKFPDGAPEQVTSGASEEEGIAFAPDGRSFVTSVGSRQSTLWIHDGSGERQITSQGFASLPLFSADGKNLYYLLRSRANRRFVSGELWAANMETGHQTRLLPDFVMEHYSISSDGNRIVFAAIGETGHSPVWLAALDGSAAPRRLSTIDAVRTFFGVNGDVFFLGGEDETRKFLYRVREDGSGLQKAIPNPVAYFYDVSPDAKSLAVLAEADVRVYPADGGSPAIVCTRCGAAGGDNRGITPPAVSWSRDGKFVYLNDRVAGQIYAVPLRPGRSLPPLPVSGLRSPAAAAALPGVRIIRERLAFVGPSPSVYAFPRITTQRNIYRVFLP